VNRRPEYTAKLIRGAEVEQNVAKTETVDLLSVKLVLEIIAFEVEDHTEVTSN